MGSHYEQTDVVIIDFSPTGGQVIYQDYEGNLQTADLPARGAKLVGNLVKNADLATPPTGVSTEPSPDTD